MQHCIPRRVLLVHSKIKQNLHWTSTNVVRSLVETLFSKEKSIFLACVLLPVQCTERIRHEVRKRHKTAKTPSLLPEKATLSRPFSCYIHENKVMLAIEFIVSSTIYLTIFQRDWNNTKITTSKTYFSSSLVCLIQSDCWIKSAKKRQ